MRQAITSTSLDLTGKTVLTEAATGAYVVTSIIAALANARRVFAFARDSRHGSVNEISALTMALASACGVADRISVIDAISPEILSDVDIVTNSGHLRPITASMVDHLPERAVIALMFEAWEFRPSDIDMAACRRRQIPIVGVNENHPAVDVFSYLGPLSVRLLNDAGIPVYNNRIALICDNSFAEPMLRGLRGAGARTSAFHNVESMHEDCWDAIVVALKPSDTVRLNTDHAAHLARVASNAVIAQFWGDVDRKALTAAGFEIWPPVAPRVGHMAILLSAIGPDPIIRLQTGGLRAAEVILRDDAQSRDIAQPVDLAAIEEMHSTV